MAALLLLVIMAAAPTTADAFCSHRTIAARQLTVMAMDRKAYVSSIKSAALAASVFVAGTQVAPPAPALADSANPPVNPWIPGDTTTSSGLVWGEPLLPQESNISGTQKLLDAVKDEALEIVNADRPDKAKPVPGFERYNLLAYQVPNNTNYRRACILVSGDKLAQGFLFVNIIVDNGTATLAADGDANFPSTMFTGDKAVQYRVFNAKAIRDVLPKAIKAAIGV